MLIFLYGPDTYRSRQKLNEIIEHYKKIHKSGLNLQYFDAKNLSFEEFQDGFQQSSMFREKKLLIVKNSFSNQEFKEKFLKHSRKFVDSQNIVLFYEEGKTSYIDALFKFLKKSGKSQEFKPLESQGLKNWIRKEIENYDAKIAAGAIEKLIEFVGNDLWRQSNEIKKLINFRKDKNIQIKDVELLVRPEIETDIFKTIDAIASKNKKRALELLRGHLKNGDSPVYLLSMIIFQFRNLLMMKSSESGKLGMHPYVARKTLEQAGKFTFEELKKIYQKIFQTDLDIKTGRIEPETALDLLIAEI